MNIVIGLVGPKTCGKSTVTGIIGSEFEIQESALADKLKNASAEAFNLAREQFDRQDLKEVAFSEPKPLTVQRLETILNFFGVDPYSYKDAFLMQTHMEFYKPIINKPLRSPREIAQIVGTEILRFVDKDVHCRNVNISNNCITVVSDVRFTNELDYFSSVQGVKFIPIYIQRNAAEEQVKPDSHISERQFMEFRDKCFKVDNNNSLDNTKEQVMKILKEQLDG
jgi:hypothetical protein